MTIVDPAAPNALLTRISSIALFASPMFPQTITPLPSARPSAFTAQRPPRESANFLAEITSEKVPARAVGMPCRSMKSCEKALEDSNCAAFWFAPQIRSPFFWNRSAIPSASGLSGPTTVKSTPLSRAKSSCPDRSSAAMLTHSTGDWFLTRRSSAIPVLPGAHHIFDTCEDCASFQTRACSRPPEPMTRSFIERESETGTAEGRKGYLGALQEPEVGTSRCDVPAGVPAGGTEVVRAAKSDVALRRWYA